jgi:acyl carrier protein
MEITEFLTNFSEQFDDTDESLIHAETDYKNLDEWSSLVALSVIAMVDDLFEVEIGSKEIIECNTIKELYNIVKSRV